jgi:uncharacterized protein (TIGR02599 family)
LTLTNTTAAIPSHVNAERAKQLAENIILLVIAPLATENPESTANPHYIGSRLEYDSAANGHELPAALRLVLVAIDEGSAERLRNAGREGRLLPHDVFKHAAGSADLDRDLETLRRHLDHGVGVRVAYQIFDATISLPASRWNA